MLEYIEKVARREDYDGASAPRTVCLLETEALMNSNTLTFLSSARGYPFGFGNVVIGSGGH